MSRPRRGTTMMETLVAMCLLAAAFVATAQMLAVCARQRQAAERQFAAQLAASNTAERIAAMPFADVSNDALAALAPSPELQTALGECAASRSTAPRIPTNSQPASGSASASPGPPAARPAARYTSSRGNTMNKGPGHETHTAQSASASARSPATRPAAAFTLIEMIAVISLVSAILGGVAVLLQGVWRAERARTHHSAQYAAIHRAGELFRTDVRAGDVDLAAGQGSASRIVVTLPDQRTIEYTAGEARIDRQVRESGQIARRRHLRAPPGSTATWLRDAGELPVVSLLIKTPRSAEPVESSSTRTLRIDAALRAHAAASAKGADE